MRDEAAIGRKSRALAGEELEYFAHYKLRVIRKILGKNFSGPILDYACKTGDLVRLLAQSFDTVHGYDPSPANLELARKRITRAELFDDPEQLPKGHYSAIVLAGALRQVPPENRPGMMRSVVQLLANKGKVIVFEHNSVHPVMQRLVRDVEGPDTIMLPRREIKRLLKDAKLSRVEVDYIVFLPRALSWFRPLEPLMGRLPFGAQIVGWGTK